jgi:tetratricopeptide (TPR) repeat protein
MKPLSAPAAALGTLGLLAAVVLVYANSLAGPFQFDDYNVIVDNPSVHGLAAWWQSMPGIRPLLKLSYALNWAASPSPQAFRALNVAMHAGNGLVLWAVLRQWLPALAPAHLRAGASAYVAALLFVLHPAATEAVTYLSGRSLTLMAAFYLPALWLLRRSQLADEPARWQMAATLAFAAALAVRETAVTLPLAWLLLCRATGQPWRQALRPLAGPLAVLLLAATAAMLSPGYQDFFAWSLKTRGLVPQLLGQLEAHAYLLTHPLPGYLLNIDPDVRVPAAFATHHALLLAAAAGALALAWRQRSARPWLLVALGWYALHLAPGNSLLPRFDLANDRHLYLALPGPLLALSLVLLAPRSRALAMPLVLAAALGLGGLAERRNHDYRSELALWEATVAASPAKARPWSNLGYARQSAGDVAGAAAAYRCALSLDPRHRQAAWNLAALGPGTLQSRAGDCTLPRPRP